MEEVTPRRYTVSEYLELEHASAVKHEFRDGELLDMSGGTATHSLISTNVIATLHSRLRDTPCRVFDGNLRVQIYRTVRYAYPDAMVVCGEVQFATADARHTTITNPKLVVEVLSPSTESRDRGEKFAAYIRNPALEAYVMVAQDEARVETFVRQENGTWSFAYFEGASATAALPSLGIELPLGEVYARIDFPPRR